MAYIEMKDVKKQYRMGEVVIDALSGVNFSVEQGDLCVVVGPSCAGKTTLLNLLMAGSMNYRGRILLDGIELRDISSESLYEMMSVIQQNVFVFNSSIKDNVSMFREFPQKALDEAISHAHLSELIARRGEDYLCGENG